MPDLQQIKDALAKATPGPWDVGFPGGFVVCPSADRPGMLRTLCTLNKHYGDEADTHLIANAATWLAALVERVERLREFAADVAETADARFCLPGGRIDPDWERIGVAAHELKAQPAGEVGNG